VQHTWRWYCCRAEVESVPLCTLSDCVCCGVCTTHDFRASYRPLADLWRFTTSTRVWDRSNSTAANGAGPSARWGHVMTSVGLDLWLHGGSTDSGEGDSRATHVVLVLLLH